MKFSFLPSFCIETKSWQKHQSLSDSNNLTDFNNINKKFLPRKSSQKNSPKKFLQKKSPKKSRKNPKNFPTISQKVPSFQNIKFPTSHLEAEDPFGLVSLAVHRIRQQIPYFVFDKFFKDSLSNVNQSCFYLIFLKST